jgi:hypothetical protein
LGWEGFCGVGWGNRTWPYFSLTITNTKKMAVYIYRRYYLILAGKDLNPLPFVKWPKVILSYIKLGSSSFVVYLPSMYTVPSMGRHVCT